MNLKYLLASALVLASITGINASQNMEQTTTPPHADSDKAKPEHHKHARHKGKHHKGKHHEGKRHHHGKKHHNNAKKHGDAGEGHHPTASQKAADANSVLHVEPAAQARD